MYSVSLNERLLAAIHTGNYEETLACLMEGARATTVYAACGRTAVGTAALVGDVEILELLIQSCEEPDLDIFRKSHSSSSEMELDTDTTPDGMDNLEWEDEFDGEYDDAISGEGVTAHDLEDHTSLYFYYAKTFELCGGIISMDDLCPERSRKTPQDAHTLDVMLMTPLHYAAACGHLDCTRMLLQHGARVDAVNSDGYTPLHVGAEYVEVTRLLLNHGANVNLKTINTGETALHLAIRSRCSTVAQLIVQHNANINETDDIDQTPLMCAIVHNLDELAVALLERKARINLQDKEGHTALYYAVLQNSVPLAEQLLRHGARRVTSHYLLHHCVRYNMRQMAELLLSHGDSLNVRNKEGVTPILLAVLGQKADMLEYLLHVAAVTTTATQSYQLDRVENELLLAVQYIDTLAEFRPIARILFAHSAAASSWMTSPGLFSSACCYIPYCQTPLARAIMLHKLDIAEFLLKEGADVSQLCGDHVVNTLRSMEATGSAELCRLLVHAGFKFPYRRAEIPAHWKQERKKFEEDMRQLCEKPLMLQSLARTAIRRRLVHNLSHSASLRTHYQATKQESSLERMIKQLEIPKVLRTYLLDFDDCPTVMNSFKCQAAPGGRI